MANVWPSKEMFFTMSRVDDPLDGLFSMAEFAGSDNIPLNVIIQTVLDGYTKAIQDAGRP